MAVSSDAKVMFRGQTIIPSCKITGSAYERMVGLLKHKTLPATEAIWIEPCTSVHTFFMRFPIDVAFLDRKGKVLALYEGLGPWRHSWIHPFAAGALEAAAGTLAGAGVKKGEVLEICRSI